MTFYDKLSRFFAHGGCGTDREIAALFQTKAYIIRGYISTMNKRNPGMIQKRPIDGQRKQQYFQPRHKAADQTFQAPLKEQKLPQSPKTMFLVIDGVPYKAIRV